MNRSEENEKKHSAEILLSKAKEAEAKQKVYAVKINDRTTILVEENKMKDQTRLNSIVEKMQQKYNYGRKKPRSG